MRRTKRHFTPEQKANIVNQIETDRRNGMSPPSHAFEKIIEVLKLNRDGLIEIMLQDSKISIEAKVYPKKKSKRA